MEDLHLGFNRMISTWRQLIFILLMSCLGLVAGTGIAWAQSDGAKTGDSDKAKRRTTVDFEDQLIEGQTQKPELFYLLQQRNNNFKRLIILRENFLPEMRKTSEEISRKGSGN